MCIRDSNRKDATAGTWGLRFRDVAREAGLDFVHFSGGARSTQLPEDMGSGCAFGDFDGDGDWDLFVADTVGPLTMTPEAIAAASGGCRLFRNDGGTFSDVTAEAGLGGLKGTYMGAAWGDYDGDGFPDLAVTCTVGLASSTTAATDDSRMSRRRPASASRRGSSPVRAGATSTATAGSTSTSAGTSSIASTRRTPGSPRSSGGRRAPSRSTPPPTRPAPTFCS